MIKPIPPIVEKPINNRLSDEIETHPAYGIINASRVTGDVELHGTDFVHHEFMRVTIRSAESHRGLSHDYTFARGPVIAEVYLSEAQWARFVSAPNIGDGVPCTLNCVNGEVVPGIAHERTKRDQFSSEMRRGLEEADRIAESAMRKLNDVGLSKKEMRGALIHIHNRLTSHGDFVAKSFDKYIDNTIDAAKIEVNAHIMGAITKAGLAALGAPPPLELRESISPTQEGNS